MRPRWQQQTRPPLVTCPLWPPWGLRCSARPVRTPAPSLKLLQDGQGRQHMPCLLCALLGTCHTRQRCHSPRHNHRACRPQPSRSSTKSRTLRPVRLLKRRPTRRHPPLAVLPVQAIWRRLVQWQPQTRLTSVTCPLWPPSGLRCSARPVRTRARRPIEAQPSRLGNHHTPKQHQARRACLPRGGGA